MTYIALLRAINVGGHTVKMEKLRGHFSEMGFTNVRTYIQTGNVFFVSQEKDVLKLQQKIEKHLLDSLGYKVPTFILSIEELEHVLKVSPFNHIEITPDTRHFIMFTAKPVDTNVKLPIVSPKEDYEILQIEDRAVFMLARLVNGKLGNTNFVEKTFDVDTTGRFFHTTKKILEAAKKE
jgi:uncharacterized protein (DUF1697 family)